MTVKTDLPFPSDNYISLMRDLCAELNGPDSFQPELNEGSELWSAKILCSRGEVLEKAGFARIHILGGTREGGPADISFFQTLIYPKNPCLPGFIIMTNMSETETMGRLIVCYTDLIIQNRGELSETKASFSAALKNVCNRHDQSFEELNEFSIGKDLLGGTAGECGILCFGDESDISFLDEMIKASMAAYKNIILKNRERQSTADDYKNCYLSRARLIEWIITDDYGIKISRENGISMSLLETYIFPPRVEY